MKPNVPFIVSLSTPDLSHRKPAPAGHLVTFYITRNTVRETRSIQLLNI